MLDGLVLKNAVECTSQHLKWTSGARVMITFHASRSTSTTTEEVPRPYGRGTSSVVSFVVAIVAMNRVDVVNLVVDLVDVDLR